MDRKPLTPRQSEIMAFIRQHVAEFGHPPTYPEIAAHVGSKYKHCAFKHVERIIAKGYLTKRPGKARTLTIVEPSQ